MFAKLNLMVPHVTKLTLVLWSLVLLTSLQAASYPGLETQSCTPGPVQTPPHSSAGTSRVMVKGSLFMSVCARVRAVTRTGEVQGKQQHLMGCIEG